MKNISFVAICINMVLIMTILGINVYAVFFLNDNIVVNELVSFDEEFSEEKQSETNEQIAVEIKGAVVSPGVYYFENGALVDDLVKRAGGVNNNAFTNNINFSKHLENEMVIYVYTNYEYHNLNAKKEEIITCNCPTVDTTSCLNTGISIITANETTKGDSSNKENTDNGLININMADAQTLTSLNGIGESKAKSIVEYRQTNGNFTSIEDVKKVSGISETIYEKIKNYITV